MRLTLNLKTKELSDDDNLLNYTFESFNYDAKYEMFYLDDNLDIKAEALAEVIFDPEVEEIEFEADYEEDNVNYLDIDSNTNYKVELLKKDLQYAVELELYKHPMDKDMGTLKGKAEVYYDYDNTEFNIKIKDLYLV